MIKPTKSRNFSTQLQVLNLIARGVLLINASGQIAGANRIATTELGYTQKSIVNRTIFEINPRYSMLGWKKKWDKLQKKEELFIESELLTKSNILYPVKTQLKLVYIDDEPLCCYVFENLLETNRYKDLLELTAQITKIGSWEYDLVSQQILLTQEVAKLFGDDEEEIILNPLPFLLWLRRKLDRNTVQELLHQIRQTIEDNTDFDLEVFYPNLKKQISISAQCSSSEGITSKIFGIAQDISKISGRSEEMYMSQFTMDNAIEMIFWVRRDHSIQYVNKSVCNQLGYSKTELLQLSVFDIVHELTPEKWENLWTTLKKEKSNEAEAVQITKNGQLLPVISERYYLKYKDEEYICAFVRNKKLQKGSSELLDLTYHTLNQSNDMILWVRPDQSFIYFNETTFQLLGYQQEELQQMGIQDLYDGYDFFEDWDAFRQMRSIEVDHSLTKKDGTPIPIEAHITFVTYNNQECACITYREIRERQKKEKALDFALEEIEMLKQKLIDEKSYLRQEVSEQYNFNNIITTSPNYQKVLHQIAQVATTDATVLILGETGTGKELLARSIHQLSEREDEVMVKINCAALPENLIESELFGHEKGAFTGAHQRKIGRFELADKGTIFLDEIGEMPLELQSKLLRVLQEGEFERVGSTQTIKVDVRVIAATNRNLEQRVTEGKFREDLYYRLNVFPIRNLPLRERKEDIPLLIQHFTKKFCQREGRPLVKIPKRAVKTLMKYNFPGNVRELENIVERALILSTEDRLNLDAVINRLKKSKRKPKGFLSFDEMQKRHIIEALEKADWKITGKNGAAELLGMNGKTLASKMRKLGISRSNT